MAIGIGIFKLPPARGSRRPTVVPLAFHWILYILPMYSMIHHASEVLTIRILDASGPRSSKHDANNALWELRIQILDTYGP